MEDSNVFIEINPFHLFKIPVGLSPEEMMLSIDLIDLQYLLNEYVKKKGKKKELEFLIDVKNYREYYHELKSIANEFGFSGKMRITKNKKGESILEFYNYVRANRSKNISRILSKNELAYFENIGTLGYSGVKKSLIKDARFLIVITIVNISLDTLEAFLNDEEISWKSIAAENILDLNKALLSSLAGAGVGALLIGVGSVFLPVTAMIAVGLATGYLLDKIDEKFQISKNLNDGILGNHESLRKFEPDKVIINSNDYQTDKIRKNLN